MHIVPADLSSAEGAQRLFDEVTGARKLRVTMLVANAGVGHTEAFLEAPFSKVGELINLNVLSLTQLARLFGQEMAERGLGRIMTVSSIAGAAPGPLVSVYSATKAYVTSFTQALQVRACVWLPCCVVSDPTYIYNLIHLYNSTSWSRRA